MDANPGRRPIISPPIAFAAFFLLSYGGWATVNSYWPVYFNSFGYSNTQIGVLSAIGPFAAMFGLLFWGTRVDRARRRNNVLLLLCALVGVISQLYLLNDSFFYTFALSVAFMFCFYSITPTGEAMFLEYAQRGEVHFGKVRIWGSVGLALVAILPGLVISRWGIRSLFPSYLLLVLLTIAVVLPMPGMSGGQSGGGKRVTLLELRRDGEMVGIVCFLFILHTTLGFYFSFFPIYMDNLGAANLVGVNNLAQFVAECVLMYFAVHLARRFGFAKIFAFAFALTAARMLLIGSIRSPVALIFVNLVCGMGYSLCMMMFTFFALRAPKELRTSAQMLNAIVAHGVARFCGSMIGGALSDVIGIPGVFLCAGIIDTLLFLALALWLKKTRSLRDPVLL